MSGVVGGENGDNVCEEMNTPVRKIVRRQVSRVRPASCRKSRFGGAPTPALKYAG